MNNRNIMINSTTSSMIKEVKGHLRGQSSSHLFILHLFYIKFIVKNLTFIVISAHDKVFCVKVFSCNFLINHFVKLNGQVCHLWRFCCQCVEVLFLEFVFTRVE